MQRETHTLKKKVKTLLNSEQPPPCLGTYDLNNLNMFESIKKRNEKNVFSLNNIRSTKKGLSGIAGLVTEASSTPAAQSPKNSF
jgi:hypothetical protein